LQFKSIDCSTGNDAFKQLVKKSSQKVINTAELYAGAAHEQKLALLGSTFPEKISFDAINGRTKEPMKFWL
jgi:hypothetical protein